MATIYNARSECAFEGQSLLFDTNVWITINGYDPGPDRQSYSDFFASALRKENQIVTCNLVVSELFNRMCKIEYELLFGREEFHLFKERRKTNDELMERIESVRDTCLNVLDECTFLDQDIDSEIFGGQVQEAAKGNLDLTDVALVDCCRSKGLVFVSHDKDFEHVELDLVTANPGVLKRAGH